MINKDNLLKIMKEHFPRWMQIRNRVDTSNGGMYLQSIAELVSDIDYAIKDYKKEFFLQNHLGKEQDVISKLLFINVGDIDINTIKLINPDIKITTDIKEFFSNDMCYYDSGQLFFKKDYTNDKIISYSINDYKTTSFLEDMYVWNIYDEFATFLGLTRYENESNEELVKRMLTFPKITVNSTHDGLKHAILSELVSIDDSLTEDEIKIEPPTPENLLKQYDEFKQVIDKLAETNRDVYRFKRWDLDPWNHKIKSIAYIPHMWDAIIETYENGVGFENDLKATLVTGDNKTNMTVEFYEESLETLKEYVKDKNINKKIPLKLKQYKNEIISKPIQYKITASEPIDLTNSNIKIECSNKATGSEEVLIDDILEESKDIQIIENNNLNGDIKFKVMISPNNIYDPLWIEECYYKEFKDNKETRVNLLNSAYGFELNEQGILVDNYTKKYINKLSEFSSHSNAIQSQKGIRINDITQESTFSVDLKNLNTQYVKLDYTSYLTPILNSHIISNKHTYINDNYILNGNDELVLDLECNRIQFYINTEDKTSCIVEVIRPGKDIERFIYRENILFDSDKVFNRRLDKYEKIQIKIRPMNEIPVTISQILYDKFVIDQFVKKGNLFYFDSLIQLPDEIDNEYFITMRSFTGNSPIINYIHIGRPLEYLKFETPIIENNEGAIRKLFIKTNGSISLYNITENRIVENYNTSNSYKAISDDAYIKLDLNNYLNVKDIITEFKITTTGTGNNLKYYLSIPKNRFINSIIIDGEKLKNLKLLDLKSLLSVDTSNGDKLYAIKDIKGFVIKNKESEIVKTIKNIDITSNLYDTFKFLNLPNTIVPAFIVSENKNIIELSDSFGEIFESVYLQPRNNQSYIAYNSFNIIREKEYNIPIVDVFYPFIPQNKNMFYLVESMTNDSVVSFMNEKNETKLWSIGKKELMIYMKNNILNDSNNYNFEDITITQNFTLNNVINLPRNITIENNSLDIAKYKIELPEGMELVYKTRRKQDSYLDSLEFISSEIISTFSTNYYKLLFSNIDDLLYIGSTPWDGNIYNQGDLKDMVKTLLKEEGILVLSDNYKSHIYISYSYKIPYYINLSKEELYKTVEYNIKAYNKFLEVKYENKDDGYKINLKKDYPAELIKTKRIVVSGLAPGYNATIENDYILISKQKSNDDLIAVKTGYYYLDGDEYYLFANKNTEAIEKTNNIELYKVNRDNSDIVLNKSSNNFIINSYMQLSSIAEIYNADFNEEKLEGSSYLKNITACQNFNHWKSFNYNLSLVNGLNGLGIYFDQLKQGAYAYLEITKFLKNSSYISLHKDSGLKVSLAKDITLLNNDDLISLDENPIMDKGIPFEYLDNSICYINIEKENNHRYFILIEGEGMIDDIIIQEQHKKKSLHKKNIDLLNLSVPEVIQSSFDVKLKPSDYGYYQEFVEVTKDNYIKNSSNIRWNLTKIKEFNREAFLRSELKDIIVEDDYLVAIEPTAVNKYNFISEPIHIGDYEILKYLILKINEISSDSFEGIESFILTSRNLNGSYNLKNISYKGNLNLIDPTDLGPYIKIALNIPENHILNKLELYAEHKTTDSLAPIENINSTGVYISEVLDTHFQNDYSLRKINIKDVSNLKDVSIYIRAAKEGFRGEVWTTFKQLEIDENLNLKNYIDFIDCRFFQIKVILNSERAYINIESLDLKGVI